MSLDLTRNRRATHEHFAVAGSYTDTYIEVQGHSPTSNMPGWYVKWVPRDKSSSQTVTSGASIANLDSDGYAHFGLNTTSYISGQGGFYILSFPYFDSGTVAPGLGMPTIKTYYADLGPIGSLNLTDMADELDVIMSSSTKYVFAIYSFGKIGSSSTLYNAFRGSLRSWRFTRVIGSSTTPREYSYAAVGTNVNDIGLIAESVQGPGSNHPNAAVELAIEHDPATLGHAGYGEDVSSGIGAGLQQGITPNNPNIITRTVDWDANGHDRVLGNEYLRFSFMGRLNQYSAAGNNQGYYGIRIEDLYGSGTGSNYFFTKNSTNVGIDGFEKHEILYKRNSPHTTGAGNQYRIELYMDAGSGSGAGQGGVNPNEPGAFIRGLEVYRAGFNPDQDRDVAVHMWHANGLNLNEGPADWDPAKADEFKTFWNSDRNLLDPLYHGTTAVNGTGATSKNYISIGGPSTGDSWANMNNVNWRGTNFTSTSSTNYDHWVWEVRNSPGNFSSNRLLYGSPNTNGMPVDDGKIYMFGVWERIREHSGSSTNGTLPNRISLTARAVNSSGSALYLKDYNNVNVTDINNHYLSSVDIGQYVGNNWPSGQRNEWKLQTGFILPEWMSTAEVNNFYQSYWAQWAGEYEWGNGNTAHQIVNASSGISNAKDARVAKMTAGTAFIRPSVRIEQYRDTTLWAEFAYPFMLEIDPMNIRDGGHLWFWDFDENTNSFTI